MKQYAQIVFMQEWQVYDAIPNFDEMSDLEVLHFLKQWDNGEYNQLLQK